MRLRPPSTPLITVDPYFSVWSPSDVLTDSETVHWTGSPNTIVGYAEIDGSQFRFMGKNGKDDKSPVLTQTKKDCDALSTYYTFEGAGIVLKLTFTTPLLLDDLDIMTRPASYLHIDVSSKDGAAHKVKINISVSEEICLDKKGSDEVSCETVSGKDFCAAKIGSVSQKLLNRAGDDIRIDWGYFYLAVRDGKVGYDKNPESEMTFVSAEVFLDTEKKTSDLVIFAYDDVKSIKYFDEMLSSYWNRNGKTIIHAISEAFADYDAVVKKCKDFSDKMFCDAVRAGGEKYAEILEISYRQSINAHKLVLDGDGNILFISKECFSNGCAATVDVSYPSVPLYLLYNPELVFGMLRPIFRFARTDKWLFDFAPHDCGKYPILGKQQYGLMRNGFCDIDDQMPVEECGNMLIMTAAASIASGNMTVVHENLDLLEKWVHYLIEHGDDPENQLCTDDFAGHLAHNCNLSLKAVMGICALGIIYKLLGKTEESAKMFETSKKMAEGWAKRASNGDGSYALAFGSENTWSMKYNIVWDKLFGTHIMDRSVIRSEFASYEKHINPYGMPLDSRKTYTKSDWLLWTATLSDDIYGFERYAEPLWEAYNRSNSRVPATDFYDTITASIIDFQNRSVVGGHFIKLLCESGKMKNW